MQKNNRFIVNKVILPKTNYGVDWFKTKEIEVYFIDDENNYTLRVEDVIKDKGIVKILLSYNGISYRKYLQTGQVLNGNFEILFNYFGIRGNKLRPFRLSEDNTYWIGITDKGKEFYFNGEYSEEIMKRNWYISNGYIVNQLNRKTIRLNRMVLGVTNPDIIVNHCGGNVLDNRVEKLSISDYKDNMKERKPSTLNNTGVTGLTQTKDNTYRIQCTINGFSYINTHNTKNEALIDLLIIQRHYGYRHNENLYYMLEGIEEEYINKLIDKVEKSTKNKKVNPIVCKNRFELSEDGSFYWMYDNRNNKCKISIEDLELVKQGNWRYTLNNGKEYFSGDIIWNDKRKGIFLHRFLFDLIDPKYRHWYIDHLDSDGLNNTRENMVITDAKGNGLNKKRIYMDNMKNGNYKYTIKSYYYHYCKTFTSKENAIIWADNIFKQLLDNRLEFKSRNELDTYLCLKQN